MASTGISEFTFGFAFLHEQSQANWGDLRAAPILPSLQREAKEGWDAHLPLLATDFYYQFKLSDHMVRGNAKYMVEGIYDGPYYRVSLHRRGGNRQHLNLRRHAQAHPNTYYVATEFNDAGEFDTAYLSRQVASRSRLIPVNECDDITDDAQHYITFQSGSTQWRQHSESKLHEKSHFGNELEALYSRTKATWRRVDENFCGELLSKAVDLVASTLSDDRQGQAVQRDDILRTSPREATPGEVLLRTAEVLSVYLGLTLVLVGSAE